MKAKKQQKVFLYVRVSTDEQKLNGFSVQTQLDVLREFAEKNDMIIVHVFIDDGFTATSLKRPALQELLTRLDEVDLILFTKLDRWFRSVAHYYKIQEILEENKTAWRAVLEDYNTETSDGKFKVNIMLSVAQQETDRTSERIKLVFENKVKNGQAITGALPIGYTLERRDGAAYVVKDKEKEDLVNDLFTYYELSNSYQKTAKYLNEKYDTDLNFMHISDILKHPLYTGEYRGVKDYCPAYITKERFEYIQMIKKRNIKGERVRNRTFLFRKLLKCPKCGHSLSTSFSSRSRKKGKVDYYMYKCYRQESRGDCTMNRSFNEIHIEHYLLNNVETQLKDYIFEIEKSEKKKQPKINKDKIRKEIDRLNLMYRKGRIEDDEYDREYEILENKLKEAEIKKTDLTKAKEFLKMDFITLYGEMTKEERANLWRSIIKHVEVISYDDMRITFL